ncbi:MAG: maltose alpha-D-glucosyltransferase [Planctomycetes bacterium RBG_16_55_9]|nr:MAG: maltose alpha-D-glucosyltransferase [Planctomycetes bacterium RBG_16_55_9]
MWYKDAIIYELHVKSFYDANGDGVGDFQGLIQKLNYLEELGVTAVWLLPFYPSPLKDDGYDIADYYSANPDYGTLKDFRAFLREAHRRDIRVITELVINHTSDQHKWFQKARRSKPGSVWRDFYVWSDTPDKFSEARIIFKDFENSNWAWDPVAGAYYWHRFFSHQPDLNYDNPRVRKEIFRVLDFWLGLGVDGLRLDAVPYLYEREGTNCENLPETHAFLKELRAHVDAKFKDRMLLAEANQWPSDAAKYFGRGDECHMAFHFPVMPRLFMALWTEDRFPIVDMLEQSLDIPKGCQWAMFLRNHDELTLEMVTDEERDYMYRAFAQDPRSRINLGIRRRLAPLLNNSRRANELLNACLLSLPGTPVIYYGDEIGMGDNYYLGDRDGVRTPMQWSADRNSGFSNANPQKLYLPVVIDLQYHYTAVNVETQVANVSSLFWFMRRMMAMRKEHKAFGRGGMEFVDSDNPHVLSFMRKYKEDVVLVVANLSRFCQVACLQLNAYSGFAVEEMFSRNHFPSVTERPYILTMGPHSFYWLAMRKAETAQVGTVEQQPRLTINASWKALVTDEEDRDRLSQVLRDYIPKCRWFGGKGKTIRRLEIADSLRIEVNQEWVHVLVLEVSYVGASEESYLLPVYLAPDEAAAQIAVEAPQSAIATLQVKDRRGLLCDAAFHRGVRDYLLEEIATSRRTQAAGPLKARRRRRLRELLAPQELPLESRVMKVEQSNTSINYANRFFLKLYRRAEAGVNPDVELSRCLTEYTDFKNFPAYVGSLEWHRDKAEPLTIGLLVEYVPNESDGWTYMLNALGRYFAAAMALKGQSLDGLRRVETPGVPVEPFAKPVSSFRSIRRIRPKSIPPQMHELMGPVCVDMAGLLGRRTAEMHLALASLIQEPQTRPEPFSLHYQTSLYHSMRALTLKVFGELARLTSDGLGKNVGRLSDSVTDEVRRLLGEKQTILKRLARIGNKPIAGTKIRIHGDYHLGQVLYTGKDFIIIDFEGEPAHPLGTRRLKRSALRDVAGMIRSFHYAAHGAIFLGPPDQRGDIEYLQHWADLWYFYMSGVFLNSYLEAVKLAGISAGLPANDKDLMMLLETFLLEKAIYELGYELNNRPDWIRIPIRGIENVLKKKL